MESFTLLQNAEQLPERGTKATQSETSCHPDHMQMCSFWNEISTVEDLTVSQPAVYLFLNPHLQSHQRASPDDTDVEQWLFL